MINIGNFWKNHFELAKQRRRRQMPMSRPNHPPCGSAQFRKVLEIYRFPSCSPLNQCSCRIMSVKTVYINAGVSCPHGFEVAITFTQMPQRLVGLTLLEFWVFTLTCLQMLQTDVVVIWLWKLQLCRIWHPCNFQPSGGTTESERNGELRILCYLIKGSLVVWTSVLRTFNSQRVE